MKNKKIVFTIMTTLLMLFAFTPEATAQKKKNKVKKHVKQNHKKTAKKSSAKVRRVAHYRYRGLPKRGTVVRRVGGVRIGFGAGHYRFQKGIWYRPYGKRFRVARAPFGIRVRVLPIGFRRIVIGPRPYFYYYGTYYVKTESPEEEYAVVAAPIGAEVDALPDEYEIIKVKDVEFYKLDDVFYEARINENGEESYIVVKDPTQ